MNVTALKASPQTLQLLKQKASPEFTAQLVSGHPVTLIIKHQPVAPQTTETAGLPPLLPLKQRLLPSGHSQQKLLRHLSHVSMSVLQIRDNAGLLELLQNPLVDAVYIDHKLEFHLVESIPLIKGLEVHSQQWQGNGTTVAVLDSGVDYTLNDFGGCTAPGVPSGCRVAVAVDIAADDGVLDSTGHGTNVAAIVAATAPQTQIAALDVSDGEDIFVSDVVAAMDWVIANHATYNIVAMNLSLGSSTTYSSQCNRFNPFLTAVNQARSVDIVVVASAGNSGDSNGIASPACTPGVVSVGAVYDADNGGVNWGVCQDNTTNVDQIACFSNSADYLTILAPGALIEGGGAVLGGTSQAAPHVSGAVALLKQRWPSAGISTIENSLLLSETLIEDSRNGVVTPRLDLVNALEVSEIVVTPVDVPMLPQWAFFMLALGIGCIQGRRQ